MRGGDDRLRAQPARAVPAHRALDPERLCLIAAGEHDAPAHDHRLAAQARVVALLDQAKNESASAWRIVAWARTYVRIECG